jgi:ribosomal protein S18 acetylase RimI-like enzyme
VNAIDPMLIETLADAAWPAAEQMPLGPWKLRATHGVTRRANSVLTAGLADVAGEELVALVERAEAFYAERGLPAVFQISAATGARALDALLAERGYAISGASQVWTADAARFEAASGAPAGVTLRAADEADDAWLDCAFDEPADRRRVHERIVRAAPRPRVFVSALFDERVAGCGMAASAGRHAGIFCMATRPEFRRRGIARAVLRALGAWAFRHGGTGVFLQVMRDNPPAQALYRQGGFAPAYAYHYRVK